ncbi:MAG: NPCBM/NEW2 domain-containing protein [Limisphaerales bacterium]
MARFNFSIMAVSVLLLLQPLAGALGSTNGLALTPPMGWNSYNYFGDVVSESTVKSIADAMAGNGMKAAGYQFINVDDGWQSNRDANGVILADPGRFPDGIKALADYVHSKGLKLGIYSDHGIETCAGKPGSYGYEYLDALTYAEWGVDYLKYDNCGLPPGDSTNADDAKMANALLVCGRPIVVGLCDWSFDSWMPNDGNSWRATSDIKDTFSSYMENLAADSPMAFVAGPGRWNDPDMLEVGNGGMTAIEDQSEFSMWCMAAAPLIAGNDLTNISPQTFAILTNSEVIAVDQDSEGEQGVPTGNVGLWRVWVKPLGTDFNTKAVALLNQTGGSVSSVTVNWTNIGLHAGPAKVRDLWTHKDLGTFTNSFATNLPAFGVVLLKVVGTAPALPVLRANYLTSLQPVYAYTGQGTIVANKSIGGNPITLNGVAYTNGIGVNSFSGVEYYLGATASRFQSDIGVDDEVGTNGSVVFQVFADGLKVYDSGIMKGGAPHQTIDLDVTGVNRLTLGVNNADDGITDDHADWAGARVIVSNTVPVAPPSPSGLTASDGEPIVLTWAATPGAVSYNVYRSTSGNGVFTNIASTVLPNYQDSNVTDGVIFYYAVSSVGVGGESATSTVAGATACLPPAVPTGLIVTLNGGHAFLNWNPVPGAASYIVVRATPGTPYTPIATGLAATAYTDTNWTPGAHDYYAVAAGNGCSQSGYSPYAFGSTNVTISIRQSGANVILTWPLGTLQSAARVVGPYSNVPAATSSYTNPASADAQFYRVLVP